MRKSQIKIFVLTIIFLSSLLGQDSEKKDTLRYIFEPDSMFLHVGETGEVSIQLVKADGKLANGPFLIYGQPRRSLEATPRISDSTGYAKVKIKPHKPGNLKLRVRNVAVKREDRIYGAVNVTVPKPKLDRIVFQDSMDKYYSESSIQLNTIVYDEADLVRSDVPISYSSSNTQIATVNNFGIVKTKNSGKVVITAAVDSISADHELSIMKNPVRSLTISTEKDVIRTGDVIRFKVKAFDRGKKIVADAPIQFSYRGEAEYGIGLPASAQVTKDGRFVAEIEGIYVVTASSSGFSVRKTVKVEKRNVHKDIVLVGHGLISNVYTSDLWIWPGIGEHTGKDFAVTGTWGANGEAYFWDVTDPSNLQIIDTVTVDARTVNDVKISADGRIGVISREGASNRKNGFVVLDVSDPYHVKILSAFNDDLTGGVHNVFIYEDHVYAVNNGRKYDIINIEDPKNPFRVGVYELTTPGHSIHDVWVENGIAYSSNWADGVHAVDVGGLKFNEKNRGKIQYNPLLMKAGQGGPSNPVHIADMVDPNGHNHAAFPFKSQSTEKFYIVAGDEWFPWRYPNKPRPYQPRGGFHFLDFTDIDHPKEEAVYTITEAGSHNHWIQSDTLYAAYYNGGLRIVDISGDLLGDLYRQGREIAFFQTGHQKGHIPNAPNVWGTIPYKGLIFFTDMYSGLYCVRLVEKDKKRSTP
ncbi:MAG: hypothetical protein QF842_05955 [Candidatus Marinimicrobia bacterium]|jgi:hypothetical protein|nr:hypothetical protein [Candidatus Neomarinimicrobiota bacterium]|tara:strand:+ start:5024 stop:7108 length:2085 start_codon:yes stop_codon:yes gene_type:complete